MDDRWHEHALIKEISCPRLICLRPGNDIRVVGLRTRLHVSEFVEGAEMNGL